eukprot:TRINITY_DN1301_c0_g1_i1.p1 TRINITY_DN1301_c0_g1~~TRINITY_DN1301_c0_g1_i1.p1  ORF type:complete len:198 (-),score=53.27 TRINITY_DN1301_c0_g1_i1:47-640(-)
MEQQQQARPDPTVKSEPNPPLPGDASSQSFDRFKQEIANFNTAMINTVDSKGAIGGVPLAIAQHDEGNQLFFFAPGDGRTVEDVRARPTDVCVTMSSANRYVTVTGTGRVHTDKPTLEKYWTQKLLPYFPQGTDTPNIALIVVEPNYGEYWDSAGPWKLINSYYQMISAALTGTVPDRDKVGEHNKVSLSTSASTST